MIFYELANDLNVTSDWSKDRNSTLALCGDFCLQTGFPLAFSVFLMTLIFNAKPMKGHSRGRRCRLPTSSELPYSINTCLNCGRFDSIPRIISTCHLVELREELNITGELIQSIGETLRPNRWLPASLLANSVFVQRNLTHVQLLQYIYTELQEFLMNLTISNHNRVITHGLRSTESLIARLEKHLCSIRSLLLVEKVLFERKLDVPSCDIQKISWMIGTRSQCINFTIGIFAQAREKIGQFLLDIDNLLIRFWE